MSETTHSSALPKADTLLRGHLVLADGTVFTGHAFGAETVAAGEVCFNTAMTGYQEILSDPSYAGQIICFTFPHIGIVGVNEEDIEALGAPLVRGVIVRADARNPSNYRAISALDAWCRRYNIPGIAGIDTRALTSHIRENGMPHGALAADGKTDPDALLEEAKAFPGLVGLDLAKDATSGQSRKWTETSWEWNKGYGEAAPAFRVVVIDYGVKRNILRLLADRGADIRVVPATASYDDIMAFHPDGVVLSNGPGDPAATGSYALPVIKKLVDANMPVYGICLGHQMLALALGAKTKKMKQGHHGANHPVKDLETGKVEIVSMNHGFTVDSDSLPESVIETHVSLFDGSNAGIRAKDKPVFSVQYHPEASPGPMDSHYLFDRFCEAVKKHKAA